MTAVNIEGRGLLASKWNHVGDSVASNLGDLATHVKTGVDRLNVKIDFSGIPDWWVWATDGRNRLVGILTMI